MKKIIKWLRDNKVFTSWLPASKGVVSMDALYKQVRQMLVEAGIGNSHMTVHVDISEYDHILEGKGSAHNPYKKIGVYIAGGGWVAHQVNSPIQAIELVKSYLIQRKSSTEIIDDATVTLEDTPL